MIHEVDDALAALVRREALNGSDIEVVFDAPTKDWASRRNAPTVNLYLYDIREDLRWSSYGSADVVGALTRMEDPGCTCLLKQIGGAASSSRRLGSVSAFSSFVSAGNKAEMLGAPVVVGGRADGGSTDQPVHAG